MAVNPTGVACGKNDELFKAAITQGYEYYKAIGTVSMKIDSLDVTVLDDYHAMVKVSWISR